MSLCTFTKEERLSRRKYINRLFARGKVYHLSSLQLRYLPLTIKEVNHHQVVFIVTKKNIKKAHQRNLLKRRLREAYRRNKHLLDSIHPTRLLLAYIYKSKHITSYQHLLSNIIDTLTMLQHHYSHTPPL